MNKLLIRERAEQIHKLFNSNLISLEEATKKLKECGFERLFNYESMKFAAKFNTSYKKLIPSKYLRSKVIYLK